MSDVMLKGVLRMPKHLAMGSAISSFQFYDRAQEALTRMELAESALQQIADMDPNGQRADDLGRAASIARAALSSQQGRDSGGGAPPSTDGELR